MRLGAHAVADDDDRRADRQLAVELDRERVHRDRADDPARLAVDADLRAREVAPEAVRVADRHEADPRRRLRDEAAPVARALARLEQLHLREVAVPPQHRLEAVVGGIGAERREAVERDTAARSVEARLRQPQRRRTVRDVPGQVAVLLGRDPKALDLLSRELGIAVRRREVAHQADDLGCG